MVRPAVYDLLRNAVTKNLFTHVILWREVTKNLFSTDNFAIPVCAGDLSLGPFSYEFSIKTSGFC